MKKTVDLPLCPPAGTIISTAPVDRLTVTEVILDVDEACLKVETAPHVVLTSQSVAVWVDKYVQKGWVQTTT